MGRFIEMRDRLVGHLIGKPQGQMPKPSPFSSGIGFEGGANPFSSGVKDSGIGFDERKNPFSSGTITQFRQK